MRRTPRVETAAPGTEDLSGVVCCLETGCADRTREGLTDIQHWPRIAVCEGSWSGPISGPAAAAICADGWHVCTGEDVQQAGVTFAQATAFNGCFSFDAASDCGNCHPDVHRRHRRLGAQRQVRGVRNGLLRPCDGRDGEGLRDAAGGHELLGGGGG